MLAKRKSRKIGILICLLVVFVVPFFLNNINLAKAETPEPSDSYTLYSNKNYDFHLDDFYDDEDLTHIYTGANFQKTLMSTEVQYNESVSNVNNSESQTPFNTGVSMNKGTFDDTDNMHSDDNSYSVFTSTTGVLSSDPQYIDDVSLSGTAYYDGSLANTQVDDGNMYRVRGGGGGTDTITFLFDPELNGRDFEFSIHTFASSDSSGFSPINHKLYVNDALWQQGTTIDFDDTEYPNPVNSIKLLCDTGDYYKWMRIYYFKLVEIVTPSPAELDFTVESPIFSNYERDDFLTLKITSNHYTSISTPTATKIYNYDTSSYELLWNNTRTSEYSESYTITSNIDDYLDVNGKVKLQYLTDYEGTGTHTLNIDYVQYLLIYKLDLTHSSSFNATGLWKYRWEVLGSVYYTQWVYFEVVSPEPNFHAVSESDYTTHWVLQNSTISAVEDFHDDINTDYWNLVEVSTNWMYHTSVVEEDVYVRSTDPNTNYNSYDNGLIGYFSGETYYTLLKYEYGSYLTSNYTNSQLDFYVYHTDYDAWMKVYHTGDFDESTATWNNQPDTGTYQTSFDIVQDQWNYASLGEPCQYYKLVNYDSSLRLAYFRSSEVVDYEPIITHNFSKNYFGSGYMYMQTNTTESIGLKSQDYGTHKTLSSGDYFEVDFQTNSDSKINLILLKDGAVQKTLTLSPAGNTNFNRHIAQISVSEDLEFDQIKISSTFEDTDYCKVYDIKTYKYTLTGDSADFYLGSKRTKEIYLTPSDTEYNLRIYEGTDIRVNTNITISETGQVQYVYTPTETQTSRVRLSTTEGVVLTFTDYDIYVNRSLYDSYNYLPLYTDSFQADEGTYAYFTVYDRFGSLVLDYEQKLVSDFINLELEVWQLEILNLMEQKTTVDINGTLTFELGADRYIQYILKEDYYQVGYYDLNNNYQQITIYLDSNKVLELNRSKLCFLSYVNQKGVHLPFEQFKTYINGTLLYENIFYRYADEDVNITITDLFDYEVYQDIYTVLVGDNYIPIILTMYSLKIMNQQEVFNHINITRDPNYYESPYSWSEWVAPNEIVKFELFAGYYKINLTDNEGGSYSFYAYTLSGDDILLISSDNTLSQIIYNIANVNTTIGNQITAVEINLSNQNSDINNTIISIDINLSNVNSTLGNLLTDIELDILNLDSDIGTLFTFTNNSFINLDSAINSSFIYLENNIWSINESISTLVIGVDSNISIMNGTINTMFTEMNNQFIVTQTVMNLSFAFLNQSITQIANNISDNHVILYNLIEQRANDIDNSLIEIQTLLNLVNSSVANESLVVQTLINVMGNNMTNYYSTINNLLNLIDNNITNNNIQLVSILELIGNNITTNHFVIQSLLDVIGNNITSNHIEMLTNLNLINMTIDQNQIELINRLLLINTTINDLFFDLSNQILLVNDTIYTAVLNLSTSVEFGVDVILGNLSLTYEQNEFLTELYKETMFSQLINWTGAGYNYSIMEDRIDVWDFINNFKNESITVFLRYNDIIDNLTVSAQNTITQFLPKNDAEYRLWSTTQQKYLNEWTPLPENKTVDFGFYEADVPIDPSPLVADLMTIFWFFVIAMFGVLSITYSYVKLSNKSKSIPPQIRNQYKKKTKGKGSFDNRLINGLK